jgi:hypothetical protein
MAYPLTHSLLRHAVQLTTGRLKLDILMGGGHIGSPLARVHFERPATMLMYCISCPTYALQPIDFQEFSHKSCSNFCDRPNGNSENDARLGKQEIRTK